MISLATPAFWKAFERLPQRTQELTRKTYDMWLQDPWHPSLHFKCIRTDKEIYSVRIGLGHRALGRKHGDKIIWFWIGSHESYNELIKRQ